MIQPGFAALAEEAQRGWVRRVFREGMVYQGGWELHGMTAEAALDASGSYVFVALTPTHRFGRGDVEDAFYSCEDDGCATEDYCADTNSQWCAACGEPRCPECARCRCGRESRAQQCPKCFIMVTAYEAADGSHEC
jgi:hypothetical protein